MGFLSEIERWQPQRASLLLGTTACLPFDQQHLPEACFRQVAHLLNKVDFCHQLTFTPLVPPPCNTTHYGIGHVARGALICKSFSPEGHWSVPVLQGRSTSDPEQLRTFEKPFVVAGLGHRFSFDLCLNCPAAKQGQQYGNVQTLHLPWIVFQQKCQECNL